MVDPPSGLFTMPSSAILLVAVVIVSLLQHAVAVTVKASTRPPRNLKRPPQFILFS